MRTVAALSRAWDNPRSTATWTRSLRVLITPLNGEATDAPDKRVVRGAVPLSGTI